MAMIYGYRLPMSYADKLSWVHITLIDYVAMITDRYKRPASIRTLPALGCACPFRTAQIQYFKTNTKLSLK
jgi:hypothetical protein